MLTIYDWFGYDLPIEQRYHLIKAAGFNGVMLWWSEGFGRGDYQRGPEFVRNAGLFIENIHTPIQNQNDLWLDNQDGEALTACYLQCVDDCAQWNIPTMVVHLPEDTYSPNTLGLERIWRIAEKAERLDVNVALENLKNFNNLSFILAQVDSPRIGFCYDCGHHYRYYPEMDLLSIYGSRMMAMHLHDNYGEAMHRLPFDGTVDWPMAMRNVAMAGYTGATAIEAMNWDYLALSAEGFLKKAFECGQRLDGLRNGL